MNKAELKNFIADELDGVTKKEAGMLIDVFLDGLREGLIKDGKVTLVGFGTFKLATQKARKARNPQTGEPVDVPEKTVPKFRPSDKLKALVREVDLVAMAEEKAAEAEPEAEGE